MLMKDTAATPVLTINDLQVAVEKQKEKERRLLSQNKISTARAKNHLTDLVHAPEATETTNIVIMVNGFTASIEESRRLANKMVAASPNTAVILFATTGFYTLTVDEAGKLFKLNSNGRLPAEVMLCEFYLTLSEFNCGLSIHATSFGAQLAVRSMRYLLHNNYCSFKLPQHISLFAPFMQPTNLINKTIPMISTLITPDQWWPMRWSPVPPMQATLTILIYIAAIFSLLPAKASLWNRVITIDQSDRAIAMQNAIPLDCFELLGKLTEQFYLKLSGMEGGLEYALRERVKVIIDTQDPKLAQNPEIFITNKIAPEGQVTQLNNKQHVLDNNNHYGLALFNHFGKQKQLRPDDMVLISLGLKVMPDNDDSQSKLAANFS